jgi:hypothetical protein
VVAWRESVLMSLWFHYTIFAHELGHHFVEQYKHKNGRLLGRRHNERIANLHAERLTNEFLARIYAESKTS